MEGSETGCGRVWLEQGRVWMEAWMEDGGERDFVWKEGCGCGRGVDGCGGGWCGWRWRGARLGVDGGVDGRCVEQCGRGCGWKMEGSETGCVDGGVDEKGRERDWVWTGVDRGVDGTVWKEIGGSETGCGPMWMEVWGRWCGRRCGLNASLRGEKFRNLKLKGLQVEMIVGERGVVVGGQRPCTKHVSSLVSNVLRCGLKYSGN